MQEIGVTQKMLAKALGCTRGAIGHYLAGRREPTLERFEIIAETLGLDTKWMVFGEDEWNGVNEPVQPYYVPVCGTTTGGRGRRLLGRLDLSECGDSAYALKVEGVTWAPRAHEGEVILLSQNREPQPGDEVWVEYADGTTDLQVVVKLRNGEVILDSVVGQRQRQVWRRSEIKKMHYLLAVFRGMEEV
jgi:transcriptional regulator with XRE-family HTH domain